MHQNADDPSLTPDARRFAAVHKAVSKDGLIDLGQQLWVRLESVGPCPLITIGQFMYGSYHILYALLVGGKAQWLIKIPANGVKGRWDDKSAAALVSEALTMHYLASRRPGGQSRLPIPLVYAYSDTTDNSVCCPYICLSYIDAVPLYKVWFKHCPRPPCDASEIPEHQKRTLDGLVNAMAELGKHTFDQGGSLVFRNSTSIKGHTFLDREAEPVFSQVGPARMPDEEKMVALATQARAGEHGSAKTSPAAGPVDGRDAPLPQPDAGPSAHAHRNLFKVAFGLVKRVSGLLSFHAHHSTRTVSSPPVVNTPAPDSQTPPGDHASALRDVLYLTWGPSAVPAEYVTAPLDLHRPDHPFQQGVHALLRKFILWIPDPFADASANNRFVLRHPDLNMQNILVADDGTVVGIVDWDGVAAVPRCLGNECYPMFLTHDWNPSVYRYDPATREDDTGTGPDADTDAWDNSPHMLAMLRNEYLRRAVALQEKEAAFSPYLAQVCRQSVVTENIAVAAYDPLCRSRILGKIVTESWAAYKKSTGEDYSDIALIDLVEMFASGTEDASIVSNLKSAFLELLKTVDT